MKDHAAVDCYLCSSLVRRLLVLATCICAGSVAFPQPSADVAITLTPPVIQPINGKLPQSLPVVVWAKDCDRGSIDLTQHKLQITGAGLSLDQIAAGKCQISAQLKVDPNAPAGNYKFLLLDATGKPVGITDFAVMDNAAGAIPSGLAPQVDVMWDVLSQSVCNDVFGKRVARNFYCIEIKLGNNTGHPIQLAGIGFSNRLDTLPGGRAVIHANTSYASTRAVLLREEVLSPRNEFFHSVQAAGLIMAGFIPYFHRSHASANYATAVSIVAGPLLQAISVIGPDRVVGQLNNLDDESFRDSQIVPNNSQVRTMVFVEKRALTEQLSAVAAEISSLRGSLSPDQVSAILAENATATKGGEKPPATILGVAATSQANLKAVLNTQAAGAEKNSRQADKNWLLGFKTGDFSPLIVKFALGDLVVVGDEIEYLQRIQVQGNPSTKTSSNLTVTPLQLVFGIQNVGTHSDAQTITVTNGGAASFDNFTTAISGINLGDFSKEADTCGTSLAAGAKCTVSVKFTPTDQGARAATFVVVSSGGTQTISLSGVGNAVGGSVSITPMVIPDFGALQVGKASTAATLTVTNSSGQPITAISFGIAGANASDFAVSHCTAPIASGVNCPAPITFTPTASGNRVATLTVTYTVGGSQVIRGFNLSGTGQ